MVLQTQKWENLGSKEILVHLEDSLGCRIGSRYVVFVLMFRDWERRDKKDQEQKDGKGNQEPRDQEEEDQEDRRRVAESGDR